ncbi:glucose-1-phosphate adenylyltransferase [Sodalis sp. TME1]|nr:glucose-1-phosphate adenylyltransferase [Sodalis sp. TME1]
MVRFASSDPVMLARQLPIQSVALILEGGRGSRLKGLTAERAKPAVHFGGQFRIIDFALSNCLNSGIRRIGVITQYQSHTLVQHIQRGWSFLNAEMNEFVDLLPAQQRLATEHWYRGTADAVSQNLDIIRRYRAQYLVILAGDHIYKMDYSRLLIDHVEKGAPCTVACLPVPRFEARDFGVLAVDADYRVVDFVEKPADPPAMPGQPGQSTPYWRDVGTLDAYWRANLDLASVMPELNIYDREWPIRTAMPPMPPAKFTQDCAGHSGVTLNSLVSGGCILSGTTLKHCVLFPRVRIHSFCELEQAVLLPDVIVGRSCRLRRCIVDRACQIPDDMIIGEEADLDRQRFHLTEEGIVLVTRDTLAKLS